MAACVPAWCRTGARVRESHFDELQRGVVWVEFSGTTTETDSKGMSWATWWGLETSNNQATGGFSMPMWLACRMGTTDTGPMGLTASSEVPFHFCSMSQSGCGDALGAGFADWVADRR